MPVFNWKNEGLAMSSPTVMLPSPLTHKSSTLDSLLGLSDVQNNEVPNHRPSSLPEKQPWNPLESGKSLKRVCSKGSSIWTVRTAVDETSLTGETEKFFEAVAAENFTELSTLLSVDPDLIHASTRREQTALHLAAISGCSSMAMIEFLVQKHADVNARDQDGNTPLHLAVASAKAVQNIVAVLLDLKADPKAQNNALNTPVHLAVREGKTEILKTLVMNTATDVDAPGQNGESAVHVAASLNRVDCLEVLLQHGASLSRSCYFGFRPIHLAASYDSVDVLRYLLTEAGNIGCTKAELLSAVDDEQGTALHAAVCGGNEASARLLIENGASIKMRTLDLTTPLHLACSLGIVAIVRLILEGCPADSVEAVLVMKDDKGMTPLHRAAMFGHWKLILMLINKGASMDEVDSEGRTPIVLAASRSANEAVSELLMLGADTAIRDNQGRNFLHSVVLNGGDQETFYNELRDDVVFGRLLNEQDKHGCTPLHYAAQSGLSNYSEALLRLGGTTKNTQSRSPLHYAAEYGRYHTVKKLLQTAHGSRVINDSDHQGSTPLHLAAYNGHAKVVQLLLTNGALIRKCIEGRTSLHDAVMNDHIETVKLLVENYSYLLDITDKYGNTALHLAALHNAPLCVQFLLDHSATLTPNKEGITSMDMAIMKKSQEAALTMVHHHRWTEILMQPSTVYGWLTLGLIKELPSVMEAVLDQCVTYSTCHPLAPEYYEMVAFKRRDLLAHPVCQSYLNSKWLSYGIYLHFANLLIYSAFMGLLTYLILRGVEMELKPHMTALSLKNLFANKPNIPRHNVSYFGPLMLTPDLIPESLRSVDIVFLCVVIGFTVCHLLKKLLQISVQGYNYFLRLTNYFELICYVSSLVFAVGFLDVLDILITWQTQWIFGAAAIFCAWFNLILHMQRYGKPGIYVGMFLREMRILIKAMSVYFIMVVAFSMAFCVLNPEKVLPDTENFYQQDHTDDSPNDWQTAHKTLQASLLRISDMLVGDVDAIANYIDPMLNDELMFPQATYFLALATVGVITLLIQAILMGTAVYEIEKIEKSVTMNMLVMQVALHTDLETKLPAAFLRKIQKAGAIVYPNQTKWRILTKWFSIFTTNDSNDLTNDNPTRRGKQGRVYTETALAQTTAKQHSKMKEVNSKMEQHQSLLRQIVQRMDIKMDVDVVNDPKVAQRRISQYAVRQSFRPRSAWKTLQVAHTLKSALKHHIRPRHKSSANVVLFANKSSRNEDMNSDPACAKTTLDAQPN